MKRLKILLQSNKFYVFLMIFILIFIFIKTIIIKYESKLDIENELIGVVIDLKITEDKLSFTLKSKEKVYCNYYIKENINFDYTNLLGKKIKITGKISDIPNNTIQNNFNFKKYLYNNKIYKIFNVENIEIIKKENILYKIKNMIIAKINNYNKKIKTYLNLFVLGNKDDLENNIYNNYKTNGIWHLFAISGMHIGFIILVLNKMLYKFKYKNIIISLLLLYFSFLTNFSASILRATIFFYLKSIVIFLKIRIDNIKILFLTAFIILIIDPFMIYNVGFQYSFIITYAIMKESKNITGNYFSKILKISIISFLVSLPITINLNYEINVISVFLNMLYVPFISLIIFPLSILTFIIPILSNILEVLINILELSNKLFNDLKISFVISKISSAFIIFYYLFLYIYGKTKLKIFLYLSLLVITTNVLIYKIDNNYYVHYLNVGQGDSTIIISPYKNNAILIDTGGIINSNYHISNNMITFFKSFGINKIEFLILSHGDYDHMGEAINLVENFKVEKVIFNCGPYNDLEQELIKVLDKKHIKYYSCIKELNIDNNKLYFLQTKENDNENDNSNVIYTKLNGYKFMFMGDASVTTEREILNKYNLSDIDVLKVGHHGSKTSSGKEFINEINPKYSIISVGKNNRYGHPNKEVLNNLKSSKIYRTDVDGSIMFKIKNNKLQIEKCPP